MDHKEHLLHEIGIVSFALTEICLFLDTHPNDHSAMAHYNHYNKIRNQMMHEFSIKYYPLTLDTIKDMDAIWDWGVAPMPWEGGCR